MRERDLEIVGIRHLGQASASEEPLMRAGLADPSGDWAPTHSSSSDGTDATLRTSSSSTRRISRGEQARRAVLARLARMQAFASSDMGQPSEAEVQAVEADAVGYQQLTQAQARRYQEVLMAHMGESGPHPVAVGREGGSQVGGARRTGVQVPQ